MGVAPTVSESPCRCGVLSLQDLHIAELIQATSRLFCDASAAQTRLACSAWGKYAGFLTQSMYVVEYLLAV